MAAIRRTRTNVFKKRFFVRFLYYFVILIPEFKYIFEYKKKIVYLKKLFDNVCLFFAKVDEDLSAQWQRLKDGFLLTKQAVRCYNYKKLKH